jgi:phosphopantothenoylcysteine decarboxylase/phosphopantothenate--cysteine ligase
MNEGSDRQTDPASQGGTLAGRTVALCVTGSVAAYKAAELSRLLVKAGADVHALMTDAGTRFLGPATLAGITGRTVAVDMWDPAHFGETHVSLAEQADVVVVAPATADVLARLAHGRADDLVTALALCARGPVLLAPAMHPRMWSHPATQQNVELLTLQGRSVFVGPVEGEVASGDVGVGRMADPTMIAEAIVAVLTQHDLDGSHVVVTAGPTLEDIDPVRFLGNRSSGRMGFAIAQRASVRGAAVTLIAGPVDLPTPYGVVRVDVRSAASLRATLWDVLGPDLSLADALIMAAAVADHRPAEFSVAKLKASEEETSLALLKNADLLAEIGAARTGTRPVLVGFAVESEGGDELIAYARHKLADKRVDLIVANEASQSFGRADNRATIVSFDEHQSLPTMSKTALADIILDRTAALLR